VSDFVEQKKLSSHFIVKKHNSSTSLECTSISIMMCFFLFYFILLFSVSQFEQKPSSFTFRDGMYMIIHESDCFFKNIFFVFHSSARNQSRCARNRNNLIKIKKESSKFFFLFLNRNDLNARNIEFCTGFSRALHWKLWKFVLISISYALKDR
jgi:hypothetical protein